VQLWSPFFFAVPSATPENVTAYISSSRRFTLSWASPVPEGRNGIITGYTVRVISINTDHELLFNTTHLSLEFPRAGIVVLPYKTYILQVAAETEVGRGPFSQDVMVFTPEDSKD